MVLEEDGHLSGGHHNYATAEQIAWADAYASETLEFDVSFQE